MVLVAMVLSMLATTAFAQGTTAPPPPPPPADSSGPGVWDLISMPFASETTFAERKEAYMQTLRGFDCVTCEIFDGFTGAVFQGSSRIDAAGQGLIPVMTGFATVFALFYLGSAFVSGDASDLTGRWQVFWRLCMAVAAGSIFLRGGALTMAWDYIFGPLFSIGTGVVNMMGGASSTAGCGGGTFGGVPAGAQPALSSMSRTVCGAYEMTLGGIANGFAMTTQGGDGIMSSIIYSVAGIMVIFIYGFLAITFPLRFIDVVLRLAIVGAITPILTLCAVFKPTRGYVSIGISNVLNATAQFAILSIVFSLGEQVFSDMVNRLQLDASASNVTQTMGNALVLVGIAVVFSGMVKAVPAIAAEFSRSSGGGGDVGGNAAMMVASAPMVMGSKAVGGASGMATRGAVSYVSTKMGVSAANSLGKSVA